LKFKNERVLLAHGSGGKETWSIVEELIVSKVPFKLRFLRDGVGLNVLDDGAAIKIGDEYLVFSVDSYTVNPIFFPGGNIGTLAASGTINDLLMMGAKPIAAMDSIIVEEGFPMDKLNTIIESMVNLLINEGIALIGGDFKVMPKGQVDKIVIGMTGIGIAKKLIVDSNLKIGDKIIVTGPIGDHGTIILASQLGYLDKIGDLTSDSKPLTKVMLPLIEKYGDLIHAARDPTRGGLSAVLSEWAKLTNTTILIERSSIPVRPQVEGFLDALGIDPLHVACEGIAVLGVAPEVADEIVEFLKKNGEVDACIIGEVIKPKTSILKGKVVVRTEIGGLTILEPQALPIPRIC